jgi:RHS repeat-associated protein
VTRWYVYDGLGSVIGELDANNNLTTSRQYDVYGAQRAGTQQGVSATSSQGYVGSLGHVTDASTGGLIYMRARYYDPVVGRFVSQDPKENGGNWFLYADNDPSNRVDADGKASAGVQLCTNIWLGVASILLTMAVNNFYFAWSNIQAGYAAMKVGQGMQLLGQNSGCTTIGGIAAGMVVAAVGAAVEAEGTGQFEDGILAGVTAALELFAAGIIMATGAELGEGTNDDICQAALSMATQPLG